MAQTIPSPFLHNTEEGLTFDKFKLIAIIRNLSHPEIISGISRYGGTAYAAANTQLIARKYWFFFLNNSIL